jgi:hypothetical protein
MNQKKKTYSSPTLAVYGKVEDITGQQSTARKYLDQPFGAGTEYGDITFSGPLR